MPFGQCESRKCSILPVLSTLSAAVREATHRCLSCKAREKARLQQTLVMQPEVFFFEGESVISSGQDSVTSAGRAGMPSDNLMLTWRADKPATSQLRNVRQPIIAHLCPCFRDCSPAFVSLSQVPLHTQWPCALATWSAARYQAPAYGLSMC
jgi:hypothetical protein